MTARQGVAGRLSRAAAIGFRVIDMILVMVLAALVVLIFTNVVLRYGFDSGISVTDEVARMMFVWIAFLGAVCVAHRNGHLGVDLVTSLLPASGKRICRMSTDIVIILCSVLLASGAWEQTIANVANRAPVSGIPTAINYLAPFVGGVGIGLVALFDLAAAWMGGPPGEHAEGPTA